MTAEPSLAKTVPSSRPMTPPPMTSSRPGTSRRARASVELRTRSPSMSKPGMEMAREPVTTRACWKDTVSVPDAVITSA